MNQNKVLQMQLHAAQKAANETKTFDDLLSGYLDNLYGLAVRLTKNPDDAKDLLQESCLAAYEKYHQLREIEKFKPWLFRIMHRKYLNNHRKKREPLLTDVELDEDLLVDSDDVFRPDGFEKFLSDEVQDAFDALPVEFREVITLADIEEFSYREIAVILDVPMGTVASRLYRGHKLLSEKLKEYAKKQGF